MRKENFITAALLASCLMGMSVVAATQSSSQTPSSQAPAASTTPAPPSASNSTSTTPGNSALKDKAKKETAAPAGAAQSSAPDAPQAPATKPSSAQDNPFPEEISKQAAAVAKVEAHDASASHAPLPSSSAEKQAQGSSSRDNTDKLGLDDPTRKQLKIESPDGSTDVYDPKRAMEDVRVGRYYLQTGYFKGAYERFKDATIFDHENVDAIFYLAEAARKLNLAPEAEQNYQLYLAAMPDGPSAKAARKALGELGLSSKP